MFSFFRERKLHSGEATWTVRPVCLPPSLRDPSLRDPSTAYARRLDYNYFEWSAIAISGCDA